MALHHGELAARAALEQRPQASAFGFRGGAIVDHQLSVGAFRREIHVRLIEHRGFHRREIALGVGECGRQPAGANHVFEIAHLLVELAKEAPTFEHDAPRSDRREGQDDEAHQPEGTGVGQNLWKRSAYRGRR